MGCGCIRERFPFLTLPLFLFPEQPTDQNEADGGDEASQVVVVVFDGESEPLHAVEALGQLHHHARVRLQRELHLHRRRPQRGHVQRQFPRHGKPHRQQGQAAGPRGAGQLHVRARPRTRTLERNDLQAQGTNFVVAQAAAGIVVRRTRGERTG